MCFPLRSENSSQAAALLCSRHWPDMLMNAGGENAGGAAAGGAGGFWRGTDVSEPWLSASGTAMASAVQHSTIVYTAASGSPLFCVDVSMGA